MSDRQTDREAELEIEVRRLEDEVTRLKRMMAKIYALASEASVHTRGAVAPRGRPHGTGKYDDRVVFAKRLLNAYQSLPEDDRSKGDVAQALGMSRRTLHRYLGRWAVIWPPTEQEVVLEQLRAEQAAKEAAQRAAAIEAAEGVA